MDKLKNYTTAISATRTVGEIQDLLVDHGITSVQVDYRDGQPAAIKFAAFVLDQPRWFEMECKADAILAVLKRQRVQPRFQTLCHASNVGWRIILNAIEAQLSLIKINQVDFAQAFFGFALGTDGRTAYQAAIDAGMFPKQLSE